jgi:tetratricopeptide (TPR) repeat protein
MKAVVSGLITASVFVAALGIGTASAQIPDEFKNLKVLPKDISKSELIDTMRGFADALGVRCQQCHVPGNDPHSLQGYDFASDKPKDKETARAMMKMLAAINGDYVAKAGVKNPTRVQCVTCHRGLTDPATLVQVMEAEMDTAGVDSAVARYRTLRKDYYGTGSYDFSPGTLGELVQSTANSPDGVDKAIRLAQLNLEFNPDHAWTYSLLGQLYAAQGNTDEAVKALEKAVELDPDNPRAKQLLDKLRSGK